MLMLLSLAVPLLVIGGIASSGDGDDAEPNEIEGTDQADQLTGTTGSDFVRAGAGDDIMQGLDGADTLLGFEGDDILEGAGGDDMLCSGDGDDIIVGNRGIDTIEGQGGNDWVSGDYQGDLVYGNEGDDTVMGGRGSDRVAGDEGNDVVFGGIIGGVPLDIEGLTELRDGASLTDILASNGDGFDMREDNFKDDLFGGAGDDELFIGSQDHADGGIGADTFNLMNDHITSGNAALINDYNAAEDAVTIVVSDDNEIDVTVDDDGEDAIVRSNGEFLARVTGAAGTLSAADITILTEGSLAQLFDPNA